MPDFFFSSILCFSLSKIITLPKRYSCILFKRKYSFEIIALFDNDNNAENWYTSSVFLDFIFWTEHKASSFVSMQHLVLTWYIFHILNIDKVLFYSPVRFIKHQYQGVWSNKDNLLTIFDSLPIKYVHVVLGLCCFV